MEDVEIWHDLQRRIATEVSAVRVYMDTWCTHGTVDNPTGVAMKDQLREHAADVILPWPQIHKTPVRERDDGRFVKAFPLEFPAGTGDLHQPRMRSDFKAIEWALNICCAITTGVCWHRIGDIESCGPFSIQHCVNYLGSKAIWCFVGRTNPS